METTMTTFAPSELVFLHGEAFASKERLVNTKLLHTDAEVSTEQLARAILAVALLANEAAGNVRLEVHTKKAWLGMRTVQTLLVEPKGGGAEWPEGSLEAQVREAAARGKANKGKNEIAHVISALLGTDSTNPWSYAVSLVTGGLASRALLDTVEKKRLKVFTTREYVLPEAVREQAAAEDTSEIQEWLRRTEEERPEVWQLLQAHIKTAIGWRTERDNDMDWD